MALAKAQRIVLFFSAVLFMRGANSHEAPIPGYGVHTMSWSITHTPGAPPQVFNGTIQQAFASAHKINPNFYEDFGLDHKDLAADHPIPFHPEAHHPNASKPPTADVFKKNTRGLLDKRDTVNCNPRPGVWIYTYYEAIVLGIKYLRGVPGQPANGPGPGNCGRVSCAYQGAIWWCNDNDFTETLDSFGTIADGAQEIVDACTSKDPYAGAYKFVKGQEFNPNNWNVIVRLDNDNC